MKRKLLFIFTALLTMAFTTASFAQIAKDVEGVYNGDLKVVVGDAEPIILDQPIIITATDDTEITLSIENFEFPGFPSLGDIVVPGIILRAEEDEYVFTVENFELEILGGELPLDIEGKIDAEGVLNVTIDIAEGEIFVEFTDGVKEEDPSSINNASETNFSIYPSASYDELNINGLENNSQYTIYNIAGLAVKTGLTQSSINITNLSKGIYIINIEERSVKFVKK